MIHIVSANIQVELRIKFFFQCYLRYYQIKLDSAWLNIFLKFKFKYKS